MKLFRRCTCSVRTTSSRERGATNLGTRRIPGSPADPGNLGAAYGTPRYDGNPEGGDFRGEATLQPLRRQQERRGRKVRIFPFGLVQLAGPHEDLPVDAVGLRVPLLIGPGAIEVHHRVLKKLADRLHGHCTKCS